ncbi:hypothetical protein [Xylophilus sp. ASV27]|uniref:hypothetical protein n=1 Tax=Xylophilus sp. ASV27 TaxID=2795129 RepID=UPI0018EB88FA|nr:hypothetical protein [Xylophilus sp. ASV27]
MASSQAMKQSSLDLNLSTKKTRKQELLAQMDVVVSWAPACLRQRSRGPVAPPA